MDYATAIYGVNHLPCFECLTARPIYIIYDTHIRLHFTYCSRLLNIPLLHPHHFPCFPSPWQPPSSVYRSATVDSLQ